MTTPNELMIGLLELQNAFDRTSEIFLGAYGLTGAQLNILNLLGEEDGTMSQSDMSDQLLIGKSSLSIVIDRMVQRGYIRRQIFPKDRRRVILKLSPAGRRLWESVYPVYRKEIDAAFGAVPPVKRKSLLDGMKLLEMSLRERRPGNNEGRRAGRATNSVNGN